MPDMFVTTDEAIQLYRARYKAHHTERAAIEHACLVLQTHCPATYDAIRALFDTRAAHLATLLTGICNSIKDLEA